MADIDSKDTAQRTFTPYQWEHEAANHIDVPGSVLMRFATRVQAVASGSSTILQIAEVNTLDGELRDEADPLPYFNPAQMANMLKLVQTSIDMLESEAENIKDWAYEQRTVEGALAAYEQAAYSLKGRGIPLPAID